MTFAPRRSGSFRISTIQPHGAALHAAARRAFLAKLGSNVAHTRSRNLLSRGGGAKGRQICPLTCKLEAVSVEWASGRVRRAIFARHCNPWSAWTRWATTPLILVPVWTRRWRHAALVAFWFAVNPFGFGKPAHHRAWATRAMLGEELWISRRPRDAAMFVGAATSAAAAVAVLAARRRKLLPAALATAVQMVLTLVYWEQMVRYFERQAQ